MKGNEGLFDLLKIVKKEGSAIQSRAILNYLSKLIYNPIFFPSTSPHNFNFEKILKQKNTIILFDNRFHSEPKIKILNNLIILEAIKKLKEEGKIKQQIMIVMDELRSFVPSQIQFTYQSILAKILSDLISTLRSVGVLYVSATTSIFDINQQVQQSFPDIIQGRIGGALRELKELSFILGIGVNERQELLSLPKNHFILLNQMETGIGHVYQIHAPPFNLFSSGQHFDRMVEKYYPEKLISHKEQLNALKKSWSEQKKMSETRGEGKISK